MAELVDALASGASGGNPVEVQVLSSAPDRDLPKVAAAGGGAQSIRRCSQNAPDAQKHADDCSRLADFWLACNRILVKRYLRGCRVAVYDVLFGTLGIRGQLLIQADVFLR